MIVVGGEALIDLILAPDGQLRARAGGGPYNVARTIARLGQRSAFLGVLSDDAFGARLREYLTSNGVDLTWALTTAAPTTLAVAELDAFGAATYRFYFEGTSAPQLDHMPSDGRFPEGTTALHVGTLGLVLEPMASTLEAAVTKVEDDILVMLDPNCRPSATKDINRWRTRVERIASRADIVKVSADDCEILQPGAPPLDTATKLLALGSRVALLTDGPARLHVLTGKASRTLDVPKVPVVDTVGAGDAFGGGFLARWVAQGLGRTDLDDLEAVLDAAAFGIRVASMTVQREGADPPRLAEVV